MAICLTCGETLRNCTCEAVLTVEREIEEEYRITDIESLFSDNSIIYQKD